MFYVWSTFKSSERDETIDFLKDLGQKYELAKGVYYDQIRLWCNTEDSLMAVKLRFNNIHYCRV